MEGETGDGGASVCDLIALAEVESGDCGGASSASSG